jgi:hypothetical protein
MRTREEAAMKANEAVRFTCGDCQIIFDLCVDSARETEVIAGLPVIDFGQPTCWTFCGAGELTAVHDQAVRAVPGP